MFDEQSKPSADHDRPVAGTHVYLLGPLRIEHECQPIRLPRRKVEALFAYLLLHPQPQSRNSLATLFWGDTSDEKARHSLRTALVALRQTLGDSLLLSDRDHVQINPDVPIWVDLYALLTWSKGIEDHDLSDPRDLGSMLALWGGELLADFYDDWVMVERERYQPRLLKFFLRLTQALRTASEYAAAIEVAQKVLTFDPANEIAHQHLMFCFVAAGDRAAALRQYEFCEQVVERELDASPLPETTALYHWIKRNHAEEASFAAKITNLPIPLTSFVGRTQQMTEVKRLLTQTANNTRLLTLFGAGGSGKTRLAIQVAIDLIDRFADGVWWVELAALTEGEQVARAVAKALGVNEIGNEAPSDSISHFVGKKKLLLVLDNCEHLIQSVAQLASTLLSHCPNLQILTTSREALNLAGEIRWPVPALTLPDPAHLTLVDLLLQYECIRLFIERATAAQPSFRLTPENAQAVTTICAQLDGIPLAIELAAARVKVLTVEQMADRLSSAVGARFELLTQGSRAALPRQQTLRAAIDWSYNLLDEDERLLFRTLSVFRGGFIIEALEAISKSEKQNSQLATRNSLDLLTQLVDKSLVVVEQQGGQIRYHLLETLREYGLELWSSVDEMKALRQRHATFFLHFAEQAEPALVGPQQQAWLNRLETEHANLRVALDFLISDAQGELALRLATAICGFWEMRGYIREGRMWLSKALLHRNVASSQTTAGALHAAGLLARLHGDFDQAQTLLQEGLHLFEQVKEEKGVAKTLQNLASTDMLQGNYPLAQERLQQSLALCRALHNDDGVARTLCFLGNLNWDQEKLAIARDYYLESLCLYQKLGNQERIAAIYFNLGDTDLFLGDMAAARTYFKACLAISQTLENKRWSGVALARMGWLALDEKEYCQARTYANDALTLLSEAGDRSALGMAVSLTGRIAHRLGESMDALTAYGQYLQLMVELGYKWSIFDALKEIAALLADLEEHTDVAVRLFGAVYALRQEIGLPATSQIQAEYHKCILPWLCQQLSEPTFNQLWEEGRTTPLPQIVAEAIQLAVASNHP